MRGMSITRWDPTRNLVSLREAMERLFEHSPIHPRLFFGDGRGTSFPVDLYEGGVLPAEGDTFACEAGPHAYSDGMPGSVAPFTVS